MAHVRYSYSLALIFLIPACALADALPAMPYLQVSGHGTLSVVPDMAHVSITIERTDKDLANARTDVERRAGQVIGALKNIGVATRDITAANISVWPEYRWESNKQIFVGQHVSRSIDIIFRDLPKYADLVSALVKAGVNYVANTTLDRSDMPQLRRQALVKAVDDAHARAVALATAAGVKLGSVYSITENSDFAPRPLAMAGRAATPGSADYEPGTINVTGDVSIVYLLKPAS
jgi:uncharacterized protein